MSSLSRNQEFKYQYKTIAVANQYFCGFGPTISVSVPENLLDIKAIFIHAVLRFGSSVPSAKRKILWAGGKYPTKLDGVQSVPDPENGNVIRVDVAADPATRVADLKLDITHIKQDIIAALSEEGAFSFDQPRIRLSLITDETNDFNVDGEVILWKIDFAYTTTGIQ